MKNLNEMIQLLNDNGIEAKTTGEFYGDDSTGIWMLQDTNGEMLAQHGWTFRTGYSSELDKLMEDNGWFIEPYDSGTFMAYKF